MTIAAHLPAGNFLGEASLQYGVAAVALQAVACELGLALVPGEHELLVPCARVKRLGAARSRAMRPDMPPDMPLLLLLLLLLLVVPDSMLRVRCASSWT